MSHERQVELHASRVSVETMGAIVTTTADPTQVPCRWAFTPPSEPNPVAYQVDGGWELWNNSTKKATAVSPSFPASDAQVTLAPGEWDIWIKWTVGSERPFQRIGRLTVY